METTDTKPTLVIGATGKTGRRVAERLKALGAPVRRASPSSAAAHFDWEDPASWPGVLEGARAAYVTYYPDLAVPGADAVVGELAAQARAAGVERLVLLSGRGEEGARRSEEAVRAAFGGATVIRSAWFAQNFSESFLADPVRAGVIALPAGQVAEPFVDAEDIAEIAVAALTRNDHVGRLYEVTGPRLLTFADAAADLSAALGRVVTYQPVSAAEYAALLGEHGVPAEMAEVLNALFAEVLDGRNESLADGVQQALGRPARDFADYAREAAAAGAWASAPEEVRA